MLVAIDLTSKWAALIYVVGGLVALITLAEKLYGWSRWFRHRGGTEVWSTTAGAIPPPSEARLDARVRKTVQGSYLMEIENTGDVPIEHVEVDLPPEATNWQLLTEALASYPIPVLDPGDAQAAPVSVSMGSHASIEVVVRGVVDGEPYERRRTVSVIG